MMKEPKIVDVYFRDRKVFFKLEDGREAGCPLDWFDRLRHASEKDLAAFRISSAGSGVFWDALDEALSAEGMFAYVPIKTTKK